MKQMGSSQVTRGLLIALRDKYKAMPADEVFLKIKQLPLKGLNLDLAVDFNYSKQNENLRLLLSRQVAQRHVDTSEIKACINS